MSNREIKPDFGDSEVVNLNNDARWQARLEEARARRAEVLRLKGLEDKPRRAPSKPWEEEEEAWAAANPHEAFGDDDEESESLLVSEQQPIGRNANADILEDERNWSPGNEETTLEAFLNKLVPAPSKTPDRTPPKSGPTVDSLFDDPAFAAPEPASLPPAHFAGPGARTGPNQTWRDRLREAEEELNLPVQDVPEAPVEVISSKPAGMPFALGLALLVLVAMPLFHMLPPMTRGPEASPSPVFGLQPAFGITAAMLEVPVATQSGEFEPTSSDAPVAPLAVADLRPPTISRAAPEIATAPKEQTFVMPQVTRRRDEGFGRLTDVLPPAGWSDGLVVSRP